MTPVEPTILHDGGTLVVFAKDQPEYQPLPASVDANGLVMTEWAPTDEELHTLLLGGRIRIWAHTFNKTPEDWKLRPLQPVRVEAALLGGRIRIWAHTFNKTPEDWKLRPLQPVRVEAAAPECGFRES